jgi:hypothetical protein
MLPSVTFRALIFLYARENKKSRLSCIINPVNAEYRISRRDLLFSSLALAISCNTPQLEDQPAKETNLEFNNIRLVNNQAFMIRNGYSYRIPNFEEYKRRTKFDGYKRLAVNANGEIFAVYPQRDLPSEPAEVDLFAGDIKEGKRMGGEINLYIAGFMTDDGSTYNPIIPKIDTFIEIRRGLASENWYLKDNVFFTYGRKRAETYEDKYQATDTAKSPEKNIKHALEFISGLKKAFPLAQFNLIAHSLGGIFALEIARANPESVNNLILINSPIRGIEETPLRKLQTVGLKPLVGDEKVTEYLFKLWANKNYKAQLDKFGESFTSHGRGLLVITAENDPFVPKEATEIKDAKKLTLSVDDIPPLETLKAHGFPLKNKAAIQAIREAIGPNLAA